ncbi:MAG: hypothetical protein EPN93_10050 [Spirochaetes bacterium]|nr:MAG: hypothetical protein EPN93_10050 [Spirochaetota bacterium]
MLLTVSCSGTSPRGSDSGVVAVSSHGITSLEGTWRVRAADSPAFASPGFDDAGWDRVAVPGNLMDLYPAHTGVAWYRTSLRFGEAAMQPYALVLGRISDADETWFNGVRIGSTGSVEDRTRHGFDRTRVYYVPARLIRPGEANVLAVRVRGYLTDSAGLIWGSYGIGPFAAIQRHVFSGLAADVLFIGIYGFIAAFFLIFSMMPTRLAGAQRSFAFVALFLAAYIFCAGQIKYLFTEHFFTFHLVQYLVGIAGTILLLPLIRTIYGRKVGTVDRIVMAAAGLAGASLILIPEIRDWTVPRLAWHAVILYCAATGLAHIVVSLGRREWDRAYVDAGFAVIFAAAALEVLRANSVVVDFNYLRFGLAGLMVSIAFFLADQLGMIRQIEARAIVELEAKVAERTAELRARSETIDRQLEIARLIQSRLMPGEPPAVPGFSAYAVCIPMDRVGGDFFDYHDGDGKIHGIVADVSGHGVPGAFLALITKMAFQSFVSTEPTNRGLMEVLNRYICQATVQSNFVTVCMYSIDKETLEIRYVSAGHVSPLLYRRATGECEELDARGRALGWQESVHAEEKSTRLAAGDRLLFYTDGVTECRDGGGGFFGADRLRAFVRGCAHLPAQECALSLMRTLRDFTGREEFEDDVTFVVVDILSSADGPGGGP